MALIAAGGMELTMYGELDEYDCPRGGGGGGRRGSMERSTRASEMSLNLDDLQLGNTSPITSKKRAPTASTAASSSTASAAPMTSANSSLSRWQESAAEEQRQRSSELGESLYDGDDEKTTTNGSSNLYDSYFWNEGGETMTQFPSLDSVLEDLSGHGGGGNDGDDGNNDDPPKANAAASSSFSLMEQESQDNLACHYPTTSTPHNSHVDCHFFASSSTGNTSSTSRFFSQSHAHAAGGGSGGSVHNHRHLPGVTTRHVHFEVPARLEAIQEFQTPDHEDYPRLYYMAHEIQKMMDEFRGEEQRIRTIVR